MEYRQLGHSGARVSVIGLGTNQFGSQPMPQSEVNNAIDLALELGINLIDSADVYQGGRSEETLGQALKGRWDRFVLATKGYFPTGEGPNDRGSSRYHILNAVENSLRRLQSDHIDLYYMHRWDPDTPVEETMRVLDDLVRGGKVRYVGASAYAAWHLAQANMMAELRGWTPFVVLQTHFHMLERAAEAEIIPYCRASGLGIIPYFPLAGGFLTGKYRRGEEPPPGSRGERSPYVQKYMTPANYDRLERLSSWAAERERGMNELAQAWLLSQPQVTSVISGASKPAHVEINARAAGWRLSESDMVELNAILTDPGSDMG